MEPTRDIRGTLVDLLDRVLDKGIVLNADIIIHVAGVPLLGLNLKACLAGMETMLKYGIWKDWDEAQRAVATEEQRRKKRFLLAPGEKALLEMPASLWVSGGIYHNWRPGELYVTNERVLLFKRAPSPEVLFQVSYKEIKGVTIARKTSSAGKKTDYLYLLLGSGQVAQLHPSDTSVATNAIQRRMRALGLEQNLPASIPQ